MRRLAATIASLMTAFGVLSLLAAPASATGPLAFAGQCQFAGASSFSSPVTVSPAPVHNKVSASGTCSGSLKLKTGGTVQLNNSPVSYKAREFGSQESCGADPNASGNGRLIFPQGALRFRVVENRFGGQAALAYRGRGGGSAGGVAYVTSDPAGLLKQCAAGGMTSAAVAIVFDSTPSING